METWLQWVPLVGLFSVWELWLAFSRSQIHGLLSGWPWPAFDRVKEPRIFWAYVIAHGTWIVALIQFHFFVANHLS